MPLVWLFCLDYRNRGVKYIVPIRNAKSRPELTLRCDGRLPTPSACLHIVKAFVDVQSQNALVRDFGHRENRSCIAFAEQFRPLSFDFIGLQPSIWVDWSVFGPRKLNFIALHLLRGRLVGREPNR